METDLQLARFQAALLEVLAQNLTAEEKLKHLREDPAFAPYRDYVSTFDLRSIETASELIRKWGRRTNVLG